MGRKPGPFSKSREDVIQEQIKEEPKIEPKVESKVTNFESFVTNDTKLVERLQDRFIVTDAVNDRNSGIRTFTFKASREEVEKYLQGGN